MKKSLGVLAIIASLCVVRLVNAVEITILRDDFDFSPLSSADWTVNYSSGSALVFVDPSKSYLVLQTVPSSGWGNGPGSATVRSKKSFSLLNGPLIFRSRILDAYVDQGIYGDAQPRGLVAGTNRNNAIEFINDYPVPNTVQCRTVANGVVTSTVVNIQQSLRTPNVYQIVATSREVRFYINGKRVATHTSNIPTAPLNVYFSTSDGGAGNVPLIIDYLSFERID